MLLDTNAISAWAKDDADLLQALRPDRTWYLSAIALGEYRYGLLKSNWRSELEAWLEAIENACVVLAADGTTARHYATLRRALDEAPALIRQLLAKAEAFLGELPWHLDASFVYGDQPKVLSGEAWSHGSPAPRLLRVIVWTGTSPGTHVTLWNKTRRNPIVTAPVFIVRPRRR